MKKFIFVSIVIGLVFFIFNRIDEKDCNTSTSTSNIDTSTIPVYNIDTIPIHELITNNTPIGYPLTEIGRITSPWGERTNPVTKKKHFHDGIDIKVNIGEPVIATADGQAIRSKGMKGALYVKIYHEDDFSSMYAHLSEIFITEYLQDVKKGDTIGLSGNTGETTGPHLHYEIRQGNKSIDPVTMFTIGN